MTYLPWALSALVCWHFARAFVLGAIDPNMRLFKWHEEGAALPHIGPLVSLALWILWPAVAVMYCRDNPQEADERTWL